MTNLKTIFKQKSKILLISLCVFGLLFSYSCKCRNQVSDPNDIPPNNGIKKPGSDIEEIPGTFSISEAKDNVKASIVKTSETVGEIKIGFVSANDYGYSLTYTVDDASETVEANKITADDFQVANNVLTAQTTLADKVRKLTSTDKPAEKTITINFTFTANDKTLNNPIQTLPVVVKLTHAQEIQAQEPILQNILKD